VREAFLRLGAEGLLRLYPQRGALVEPVSSEESRSVIEARLLLEQFATGKVIGRGAEVCAAVFERLSGELQRQRDAAAEHGCPISGPVNHPFRGRRPWAVSDRRGVRARRSRMAMYNTTPTTITAGRKAGAAGRIQWCERYKTWPVISGLFTVVVYPGCADVLWFVGGLFVHVRTATLA
jgi:hypothetical protein